MQKLALAVAPSGTWQTVCEACRVNGNFVMPTGSVAEELQGGVGCKASGCWALVSCTSIILKQVWAATTGRPELLSITSTPCSLASETRVSDGNTRWDDTPVACGESVVEVVRGADF